MLKVPVMNLDPEAPPASIQMAPKVIAAALLLSSLVGGGALYYYRQVYTPQYASLQVTVASTEAASPSSRGDAAAKTYISDENQITSLKTTLQKITAQSFPWPAATAALQAAEGGGVALTQVSETAVPKEAGTYNLSLTGTAGSMSALSSFMGRLARRFTNPALSSVTSSGSAITFTVTLTFQSAVSGHA